MLHLRMTGCDDHVCCLITIVLEPVYHHVLKHRHEASFKGHEARFYFVTLRNHVTVTKKFFYAE